MKIEKAYSLELDRLVTAEEAHEYYWDDVLTDKQLFQCRGKDCVARITCSNMDKLRINMKRDPYFMQVDDHSLGCSENAKIVSRSKSSKGNQSLGFLSPNLIRFSLTRPPSHFEIAKSIGEFSLARKNKTIERLSQAADARNNIPVKYSIRPLITLYNGFSDQEKKEVRLLLRDSPISFDELFQSVTRELSLNSVERIYFGDATIERRPNGFLIRMCDECQLENVISQPILFISDKILEKGINVKHWKRRAELIVSEGKSLIRLYALSTPEVTQFEVKGVVRNGIKFPIYNIDMIEIECDDLQ